MSMSFFCSIPSRYPLMDGKPMMLVEAKFSGVELDDSHMSQLLRYFSVTEARIGILTNGLTYRFYSDLEEPNKMDKKPFLVFNMLDVQESLVRELKKLAKDSFDLEDVISRASDLKYTREIKRILTNELSSPSEEFVKFLAGQVYSKRLTQNAREMFIEIVKRAYNQFLNERINERLQSALQESTPTPAPEPAEEQPEAVEPEPQELSREDRIQTTEAEKEAYYIVKSILRDIVPPDRVAMRDAISYCSVLLDDNNRKPICRFHFNNQANRQMSLFDENKNDRKVPINTLNEIYQYADDLKKTVGYYE